MMLLSNQTIATRIEEAFTTAKEKGWHDQPREFGTVIALMHSELNEAFEAILPGGEDNMGEELADVLIRMYDACGEFPIPLAEQAFRSYRPIEERYQGNIELIYMHRTLSQALEAYRKSDSAIVWDDVARWFAELHILIYEMDDAAGFDIDDRIAEKMEKNKSRPHRHGGKRA